MQIKVNVYFITVVHLIYAESGTISVMNATKKTTVRTHLEYPEKTMFEMVARNAETNPKYPAYEFYNHKVSYKDFITRVERAARAFTAMGIGKDDRVTICLPNIPQALDCFYALNRIGAVCNMVHPLSAENEIVFYLNVSHSKMILTADMFYEKVKHALKSVDHDVLILTARMQDELYNPVIKAAYTLKAGRQFLKYPNKEDLLWKDFLKKGDADIPLPAPEWDPEHTAAILYSGGTTGLPKGICLSDKNFNATALQATEFMGVEFRPEYKMLSCMPVFHGFGLGINIHTVLLNGGCCILMPSFTPKTYADMLIKKKPNFIAGVPTIFSALLNIKELEKADLSCLLGMFCGGDSLSVELKKKVDAFLKEHNASIQIREGYGLTECVTASCLTPVDTYREKSIGLPFPDTVYAIVKPGTDEVVHPGEQGEIILKGPSLMIGYLDNPEETAQTIRTLADGERWLYTGDMGYMDEDGYVYFIQRMKRMIITNGYNVYPGVIENHIDSVPEVAYSCVIGVPDPKRMHRVRAYVVLKDTNASQDDVREKIMTVLKKNIAAYALPKEIMFRDQLPKTLVGKVAYRKLEEEAQQETQA